MILALLLGCMGPLPDPLVSQRAALASLPAPAEPWAAQASLTLSDKGLEQAIQDTVNGLLKRGLAPSSATMMGVTASFNPSGEVVGVDLSATSACPGCLEMKVTTAGTGAFSLSNATGSRTASMGFTGALSGVLELSYDGEQVLARPAAPERWGATLSWNELPVGMNQIISNMFTETLRKQLVLTDLPAIPVVRLRGQTPVPVTGIRVRPAGDAIALDFAFRVPRAGAVATSSEQPSGWSLSLPVDTVLGLFQALSLSESYDPNDRVTPEFTGLRMEGSSFEVDVRAWPTRGRNRPRDLTVYGSFGIAETGDLYLRADSARWVRGKGDPPDLAVLLMGDRLLDGLVASMSANLPGMREQSVAGMDLSATIERFSASNGALNITGSFTVLPAATGDH